MARILVIDDEPDVALGLRLLLQRAGHEVAVARDGREGLRSFFGTPAELVLLDVSMPVMDGWETLGRLRDVTEAPILMLTARGLELEKVRGLRGGADDYQTKPYSNQELLARVDALLRRSAVEEDEIEVYVDGRVSMDFARHVAEVDGREVLLSPLEFRLLAAFVRHRGRVLSHEQLLELAWRDPLAASRDTLKTYVRYLRRKLDWSDGESPIESVRGVGYRYVAQ
ncbi:response regulator transcription factor [Baekduia sp. Peel2402]|uniref:response regulator transcription factor n=1 Tax=Baekduia sp. Peel2402 TaxID=3458296 RepID=UPI00403E5101